MNMEILHPGETENVPPATANALIPRATIEDLVARRNRALELYREAHAAIDIASASVAAARQVAGLKLTNSYNHGLKEQKECHHYKIETRPLDDYMQTAQRIVDTDFWAFIVELTDLQRIMDKKAKDELRQSLLTDPPELTVGNVYATLERFILDADMIFKRGMATAFSALDRRFRSHDGWKVGHRIILSNTFDANGWWSYHRNHEDTMIDVERALRVLDNNPADYCEIVSKLRENRGIGHGARRSEVESQYFTIRIFKNGNAHMWFKRDDLLEKVNKLLGEYYGAPIPEERRERDDGALFNAKIVPAKNFAFFPTPDAAAQELIDHAKLYRPDDKPPLTVLEPSAGTGNLAARCLKAGAVVDCVEIQGERAAGLKAMRDRFQKLGSPGRIRLVLNVDFLALKPGDRGPGAELYDRVVMNPPFDAERDIDHVMHALQFLKPDGFLVAIMSAGTEHRETRKSIAFRELMQKMNAHWRDLPHGSFASVGTYCNTVILSVFKDGHSFWH